MGATEESGQSESGRRSRKYNPSGSMSLPDHLRELRSRVLKSALAIVLGSIVGWVYYKPIFDLLADPINQVIDEARANGKQVTLTITDVAGAFTLQLKIAAIAGTILASPVWIYQLWRFITPGLHKHEKRWTVAFVGLAVPLFLSGVFLAYVILPNALALLFNFTPEGVANFPSVDIYLSFFTRMIVIFGVGFLTPLILVALNMFGILSGQRLARSWRVIVFGVFLFAAVATPTADPINLLLLALPILVLVGAALVFCFLNDKRRARKARAAGTDYSQWADDETSPL
jgi:sec-independent protein translocase protein TatC